MQTKQAQQANWLVTRNLLTSSGEGSKENVSIKEDKLGKLHSTEPHRYIFLQMVSLSVWLFPIKVNLITRKLKIWLLTEVIMLNTYCLHQNLPSHGTSRNSSFPFYCVQQTPFPIMDVSSFHFPQEKSILQITLHPQSRLPVPPQCRLGAASHSYSCFLNLWQT